MGDIDIGEMFLNFMIDPEIWKFCGVDISHYIGKGDGPGPPKAVWERWERCLMGVTTSPYQAIQALLWADEVVRGDREEGSNPFCWDRVRMNLPGSPTYDPTLPWVSKVCQDGSTIASDFFSYVDDLRSVGALEEDCWLASRRVASRYIYLGIQDAAR